MVRSRNDRKLGQNRHPFWLFQWVPDISDDTRSALTQSLTNRWSRSGRCLFRLRHGADRTTNSKKGLSAQLLLSWFSM